MVRWPLLAGWKAGGSVPRVVDVARIKPYVVNLTVAWLLPPNSQLITDCVYGWSLDDTEMSFPLQSDVESSDTIEVRNNTNSELN